MVLNPRIRNSWGEGRGDRQKGKGEHGEGRRKKRGKWEGREAKKEREGWECGREVEQEGKEDPEQGWSSQGPFNACILRRKIQGEGRTITDPAPASFSLREVLRLLFCFSYF